MDAISKAHVTAVGPDDIHYQMLKHLPTEALQMLLGALNDIWYSGNFPNSWHTSTVIPVSKPGKDKLHSSNYHPIALTSCLCKIVERMINNRLVWYFFQPRSSCTIGRCSEINIKCVVHDDLERKNRTTQYNCRFSAASEWLDFLSFIVVEHIRFFRGALHLTISYLSYHISGGLKTNVLKP